jgi:PIN domain nuclease of toxin-antitoxin system
VSVLLDAFALIALLAEEPAAERVETLIRRGDTAITAVNLAEALDVLQRVGGISRERLEALTTPLIGEQVRLEQIDEQIARDAADIRARRYHRTHAPLSLADCILLAATRPVDTLATADAVLIRTAEAENRSVIPLASW